MTGAMAKPTGKLTGKLGAKRGRRGAAMATGPFAFGQFALGLAAFGALILAGQASAETAASRAAQQAAADTASSTPAPSRPKVEDPASSQAAPAETPANTTVKAPDAGSQDHASDAADPVTSELRETDQTAAAAATAAVATDAQPAAGTPGAMATARTPPADAPAPGGVLEDVAIWDGGPSMGGSWIAHSGVRRAGAAIVVTPQGKRVATRIMGIRGGPRMTGFVVSADLARELELIPGAPMRLAVTPEQATEPARAAAAPPAIRAAAPLMVSPPQRPGQGPRVAALPSARPAHDLAPPPAPPSAAGLRDHGAPGAPSASPSPPARPAAGDAPRPAAALTLPLRTALGSVSRSDLSA